MSFQGLAVLLGKIRCPELVACERHNDFGLDAYASAAISPDGRGKGLASSTTGTRQRKSRSQEKGVGGQDTHGVRNRTGRDQPACSRPASPREVRRFLWKGLQADRGYRPRPKSWFLYRASSSRLWSAPFGRSETAIDECLSNIKKTQCQQIRCQCLEHALQNARLHPLLKSSVASLVRRVALR